MEDRASMQGPHVAGQGRLAGRHQGHVTVLITDVSQIATEPTNAPRRPTHAATRPSRRVLMFAVGVLMVLTFGRGLFWAVSLPVWTGDEGAHYS
jgi:hypothetical protein